MGKQAHAGGGQAKAKAAHEKGDSGKGSKKGEASKVKEEKGKEKDVAKGSGSKAEKPAEKEADSGPAKLLEEAQQAYADDEKNEKTRVELRELNRQVRAKGWGDLAGKRDKSIVKVQKFQNKLKQFKGEADLQSVMSDIDGVDASKYVSELADCLMEAAGVTLKLKELNAASKVCSRLHATYEEFSGSLGKAVEKAYNGCEKTDLTRRRMLLRLCAELCLVECLPAGATNMVDMVKKLSDISLPEEEVICNFTILASLVQKHAVSCLNIVPRKQKAYEEALGKSWVQRECVLDDKVRSQLLQHIINAYQAAAAGLLQSAHTRLLEQEKVNAKLRVDKGMVDEENEKKHQTYKENFTKLQGNLSTLSEYLNQPLPKPEEEIPEASRLGGEAAAPPPVVEEVEKELPPIWDDNEQQRYYEEITDLKDVVPAVLLTSDKSGKSVAVSEEKDAGDDDKDTKKKEDKKEQKEEAPAAGSPFELYLMRVANAESAKLIDDLIIEFLHEFNTKGKRVGLAQQLLSVNRNSLHMLAPHARVVAIVAPYLKEIPNYVMSGLKAELEQMLAEKDPVTIESKVKTVRFLCELCKFKICPPGVILDTFKILCDNFSQHSAELCSNILQCCGRFLLYTPETATRTENLLERMMRLKNVKSLGLRLEIMLEDSYYHVKPPEGKRAKMKEKEPLEAFIEHLIFHRLYLEDDEEIINKVLRLVRKLPGDGQTPIWLKKCILELNLHANYENIFTVASLLSGLAKHRTKLVIEIIDALLESVQSTLERNDFREMPLRVRQAKLIGELYNYKLVDSHLVFDTMYHFIGFGGPTAERAGHITTAHKVLERCQALRKGNLGSIAEEVDDVSSTQLPAIFADPQHPLEPPWDFFRIKLVCVLLDTCGHYFDRGPVKQRLDRFLQFFLRYTLSKGDLPLRVMFMVGDTLERIRPKLVVPTEKAKCDEAILKLLQKERETLDFGGDEEEAMEDGGASGDGDESTEDDESRSSDSDSDSEDSESESDESDSEESDSDDNDGEKGKGKGKGKGEKGYSRGSEVAERRAAEEEDFEKEVQQFLLESLEREKKVPRSTAAAALPEVQKRTEGSQAPAPGTFSLMARPRGGGGKAIVKQIEIPEDSKLARVSQTQAENNDESREMDEVKRKTMEYVKMNAAGEEAGFAPQQRAVKGGKKGFMQRRPDGMVPVGGKGKWGPSGGKGDYPDDDDWAAPRMRVAQGAPPSRTLTALRPSSHVAPAAAQGSSTQGSSGRPFIGGGGKGIGKLAKGAKGVSDSRGTPVNPRAQGAF